MGQGQSISIESATAAQKEKVGQFSLRSSEKHTLQILGDLLDQLLQRNNLFDLSQILNSAEGCNKLFMVLSSTIDKEFKSLRLPDPLNSSRSRMTSFISTSDYELLKDDPLRKTACDQIAWFIIRLVTLISALTASVSIHKDMPALLFRGNSGPSARTMNTNYKNPAIQLIGRDPIPTETLNILLANGLRRVKLVGSEQDDARPLYTFGMFDSVMIDAGRSIVYMPMTSPTGVMSIKFENRSTPPSLQNPPLFVPLQQSRPAQGYSQGYVVQPMAQPYAQPMAQPMARPVLRNMTRNNRINARINRRSNASSNVLYGANPMANTGTEVSVSGTERMRGFSTGGRHKTRRGRQRGGATMFLVTVQSLVKCQEMDACEPIQFYMTETGTTIDKDLYESRAPNPPNMQFHERMRALLGPESKVQKVALEEPKEVPLSFSGKYSPLFERNESTFERFQEIKRAIENKPEGASPASYRAFLLASQLDGDILNTMFCSDLWAEQRVTNTVAYSLLQSLYIDRQEGISESVTANDCAQTVSQFLGAKIMKPFVPSGATPSTFDNIAFLKTPVDLAPFCKKIDTSTGKRGTRVPDQKKILTDAHKHLRDLYDEQMKAVVAIVRKVLAFKNAGYRKAPILQLDPVFMSSERGAIVALETIVAEARQLLSKHYFEVEKTYYGALTGIVKLSLGNYVAPKNGKNQLETVSEELNM